MSKGEREIQKRIVLPACAFVAILLMSCDAAAKEEFQPTASRAFPAELSAVSEDLRDVTPTTTSGDPKIAANVASERPGDTKPLSGRVNNPSVSARPEPRVSIGKPMTIYWFFGGRP
jgi:hypothetical protein